MNFKDKVVIVTGGTRGIGLEVAKSFYEKEANVIIFGSKKESVDKALEELSPSKEKGNGFRCSAFPTACAQRLFPANSATVPYVATFPAGICRTMS